MLISDDDPLGSFIFRTTGFNSIRTLTARLQYFQAISGNRLSCLALELRLRGKSTRQSFGTAIYYVDITLRSKQSIEQAITEAKQLELEREASGFDQAALDQAAKQGFSNGAFEETEEDGNGIVEEFFSVDQDTPRSPPTPNKPHKLSRSSQAIANKSTPLATKLKTKVSALDESLNKSLAVES